MLAGSPGGQSRGSTGMTRSEVLAQYRPIRAGIQRVLRLATDACKRPDLTRAVKQVAPWAEKELSDEEAADMFVDVALFEPNQRGRRAFERFLADKSEWLDAVDRALAQRMTRAYFSLFRVAERHEAAGLWLEDLLDDNCRLWLMNKGLEASAPEGTVLGMRLFDAGPFHAGFGIIVARTKRRLRSAWRRGPAAGPCRCDIRWRPRCMPIAF